MVSLSRAKYLVLGLQATLISEVEFDPQIGVVCSQRKIAVIIEDYVICKLVLYFTFKETSVSVINTE